MIHITFFCADYLGQQSIVLLKYCLCWVNKLQEQFDPDLQKKLIFLNAFSTAKLKEAIHTMICIAKTKRSII